MRTEKLSSIAILSGIPDSESTELAVYTDAGGAAVTLHRGEPIGKTIAELRLLADILEKSVRERAAK